MKTNQLLRSSLTHLLGLLASGALLATALSANATVVNFGLGADDYGTLTINGVPLCTYDNISAAGGCNSSFDMQPGVWYDIAIVYKNRLGSDGMSLSWDQPGPASIGYGFSGSFPGLVPKANFRTLDAGGTNYVSGLRGDYYDLSGNLQSTVFGEGPIDAINDVYNNAVVGSWNGYGYFSLFEERLSGQISLGFDGGGQRPKDVNKFLTYANPTSSQTSLPAGTSSFPLQIVYGNTIIPSTFKAVLNGVDISSAFSPMPASSQAVALQLQRGKNVLVVSVDGHLPNKIATDNDRLTFLVP
jgi:hypothetical protein